MRRPLVFHLATLSFDPTHSPREPTRANVALDLLDHYLTDGFISKSEPVLTHAGGPDHISKVGVPMPQESIPWVEPGREPLKPLGVALQKGNARVCILHLIATLFLDGEVGLKVAMPGLWASMRAIHARRTAFSTRREQAAHNFKL